MPQQIGEFDVLDVVGQGTVGTVYHARHRPSGQAAAIKVLREEVGREPEVQRRFVREVSISEKLNHPNIVRYLDCGLHGDQIYFAMELVTCGTLKEVLRRRHRLPWREAAEVAVQMCGALEHAHRLGVIHRDLKPGNLFLSTDGKVKVGDFGLARDLQQVRLTMEGTTVGTCRYMPPEQIAGEAELTGAVDLYALGCILFEMLTGEPPFDGDTIVEIFEQHLNTPPPRLSKFVPDCPRDLVELVDRLLAKSPADRPPSADHVQRTLSDILQGKPVSFDWATSDPGAREKSTAEFQMPNLTERLQSEVAVAPRHGNGLRLAVLFAAIVLLLAAFAIAWRL